MPLYDKPVRLLFKDMVKELVPVKGDILTRLHALSWFKENYPKVKDGTIAAHLLKMSTNATSRVHYNLDSKGDDDLLYQIDSQRFRLYDPTSDPAPIYIKQESLTPDPDLSDEHVELSEFAYEKDLQNFLSKNLDRIESGLRLYEEEDVTGIEFPAGSRFIDILALDKNNNYVVIELKVSRGYDRVVGQLLRYMGWIKQNHAEEDQLVRGLIVARDISEDLSLACAGLGNIGLYEYEFSVSLKKINDN